MNIPTSVADNGLQYAANLVGSLHFISIKLKYLWAFLAIKQCKEQSSKAHRHYAELQRNIKPNTWESKMGNFLLHVKANLASFWRFFFIYLFSPRFFCKSVSSKRNWPHSVWHFDVKWFTELYHKPLDIHANMYIWIICLYT